MQEAMVRRVVQRQLTLMSSRPDWKVGFNVPSPENWCGGGGLLLNDA